MSTYLEKVEEFLAHDRRLASVASFTGPCNLLSSDYKRLYVKLEEVKKFPNDENEENELMEMLEESIVKNRSWNDLYRYLLKVKLISLNKSMNLVCYCRFLWVALLQGFKPQEHLPGVLLVASQRAEIPMHVTFRLISDRVGKHSTAECLLEVTFWIGEEELHITNQLINFRLLAEVHMVEVGLEDKHKGISLTQPILVIQA